MYWKSHRIHHIFVVVDSVKSGDNHNIQLYSKHALLELVRSDRDVDVAMWMCLGSSEVVIMKEVDSAYVAFLVVYNIWKRAKERKLMCR